ncbi:spermidine/putrescine ABC transporter substrate-binding protein [Agromyces mediolanus]|nr:spermidine/putrescine ABC transporter substrate-binding protein [Agromyces mediolanus]
MTAIAAGGLLLAACSDGGRPSPGAVARPTGGPLEDQLSIYSWADYDDPALLSAFTSASGPKIIVDSFGSNPELVAKLTAAKGTSGYDVVVPSSNYIPQMAANGLLMKLNKELLPNLAHMDTQFAVESDPDSEYAICKAWGTTGFVYDTTVINRELKTWGDFMDAAANEASGKTSVLDDPGELPGIYFWANGIQWETNDEEHLAAAEDYLVNTLAKHVSVFDSNPANGTIPQSTAVLIQAWNGSARQGIMASSTPEKWRWVLGAPNTEIFMDTWAVSATAPHPEASHAFINFMLKPESQLANVAYMGSHTGGAGIEELARAEGLPYLDMIFYTPEQVATMQPSTTTEGIARRVDIYNKMKAAASA